MDYMKNKKNLLICLFGYMFIALSINVQANYQLGKDFGFLSRPLPVKEDGVVDVIEVFWYGCGHCFNLAPVVSRWSKQKDSTVNFQKMPVTWGPVHQLHARLFYTIEALGIGEVGHTAVFKAIHKEGNFLSNEKAIINFLEKLGVEKNDAIKYMNSFSVKQKVKRAIEISKQFKVTATPMFFVDGQYRVEAKGGSMKMLKVVDYVIELQKPVS
tara:strand:+ start:672 stop:1310 length:639 start_codon:yes stop_codon:yes gene_type:complete